MNKQQQAFIDYAIDLVAKNPGLMTREYEKLPFKRAGYEITGIVGWRYMIHPLLLCAELQGRITQNEKGAWFVSSANVHVMAPQPELRKSEKKEIATKAPTGRGMQKELRVTPWAIYQHSTMRVDGIYFIDGAERMLAFYQNAYPSERHMIVRRGDLSWQYVLHAVKREDTILRGPVGRTETANAARPAIEEEHLWPRIVGVPDADGVVRNNFKVIAPTPHPLVHGHFNQFGYSCTYPASAVQ